MLLRWIAWIVMVTSFSSVAGAATPRRTVPRAMRGPSFANAARAAVLRPYVPGELLVIRRPGSALETRGSGTLSARTGGAEAVLARHGIERWSSMRGGPPSGDWIKLTSSRPDFDPVAAGRDLVDLGLAVAAAPNVVLELYETVPNDTYLDYQYWVRDLGDADVQLSDAWDVTHGDTSVVIGVLDTGVDRSHPDLVGQIWRNPLELANGLDDDGDGHVDDLNGWDFGNDDNGPDPHPVFDENGIDIGFHGTFVAALASASVDNVEGIAGAAWRCRILPLKAVNDAGEITLEATAAAFRYAWAHHVSVLNMSLGTPDTTARAFFQTMVDSATAQGVLCVAAAGNAGTSVQNFPAACNHVLSVGATNDVNQRADFSSWGPWVDIAAPGASMWSAICQNYTFDEFSEIFYIYLFGWDGQFPYMAGDGTSFSCPVVAGACALARARYPTMTPDQVSAHMVGTGDVLVFDHPIGTKLNAYRAVASMLGVASTPELELSAEAAPNPFRTAVSVRLGLPRDGHVRAAVFDVAGRELVSLLDSDLPAGTHHLTWDGRLQGRTAGSGLYFVRVETPNALRTLRIIHL